jgi:hypothetical protein
MNQGLRRNDKDTKTPNTVGDDLYLSRAIAQAHSYAKLHGDQPAIIVLQAQPRTLTLDDDELIRIARDLVKAKKPSQELLPAIEAKYQTQISSQAAQKAQPLLDRLYQSAYNLLTTKTGQDWDRDAARAVSRYLTAAVPQAQSLRHPGAITSLRGPNKVLGAFIIDQGYFDPPQPLTYKTVGQVPQQAQDAFAHYIQQYNTRFK